VVEQPVDRDLVALQNIEDTRRQPGLHGQLRQPDRGARIPFGRLQYKGVPAGDSNRKHPHRHHGGKIEWRDTGANANRLADRVAVHPASDIFRKVATQQMRDACHELDHFDAPGHFPAGVRQHLAMLGCQNGRQIVGIVFQKLAVFHHHPSACQRRCGCPARQRLLRGRDRLADIFVTGQIDLTRQLTRRGVKDIALPAARSGNRFAVDKMLHGVHAVSSLSENTLPTVDMMQSAD